ncbi:hypothetical protein IC229_32640 [Spirosoma sp. BT702]|uniref:DUF2846 domain-containing protein n=1 Tax=Spirosoma profusum TaxID=2771354 RepID=A0A927AVY3_9BACT|nr:hypothetical protein [Spirosoma profusum]MBD2705407.1 hypothetical protein [Spirosoma profusum]
MMILGLLSLLTLSGSPTFGCSTAFTSKPDSVPAQQRYHFKLASDINPNQTQWSTVFFYPSKSRSGNEIRLPLGVNQTTVRLSSGDRVLEIDEDYVFIPNANRIRVLDEDALTAQYPIRITYEGIANTVNKRLILRYRP